MTFPTPFETPEETTARERKDAEHDRKIEAARRELMRLEKKTRLFPGDKYLPVFARRSLQKRLSPSALEAADEARIEYQWTMYDKRSARRPLYPRPRALSPSNQHFRRDRQDFASQEHSPFFNRLPPEIREEVYRCVFGNLIVEVKASYGGFNGPPPSRDHRVYFGSRITDWATGESWRRGPGFDTSQPSTLKPHIVPLLQTCRRIYAEAIPLLYTEASFKEHGPANTVDFGKYLLSERLQMIRRFHFQWALGYPWSAPCHTTALETFASLKNLRKLCILGISDGLIDSTSMKLISVTLWQQKKELFVPHFRKFHFIRDVDIFLPIMNDALVQQDEAMIGNVRMHGLTAEEASGARAVYCACQHMPEKMRIR